jgi:hypothetical protein
LRCVDLGRNRIGTLELLDEQRRNTDVGGLAIRQYLFISERLPQNPQFGAHQEARRYFIVIPNESSTVRSLRLCPFGSLAKNPLTYIGRAVEQYNTLVFAVTQESYNLNVHKSDFTQVHEDRYVLIVHLSPYVADIDRLNSANEP